MSALVDKQQCFFPTSEPVDWKRLGQDLKKHFVVKAHAGGLSLVGKRVDAPKPFTLTPFPVADIPAATGMRGPLATRWKRQLTVTHTHCLSLHFSDLAEVLDEANCLILAQETIQNLTRGPIVLAWKREILSL